MASWWLTLNILSTVVLAFYSMLEMAIVSFNKVRLQYYVSQGSKRAIWLNHLLHTPSRLFGTTLIGVNVSMFIGSECAREFHSAIGIDPNLAPLTQVFFVIIFGELAPMFAARHYPEHVAMLGIPIVYASSKLMAPIVWILGKVSALTLALIGKKNSESSIFLSQDELIKILEEQDEEIPHEMEAEDVSIIASNIFRLRDKNVGNIMLPIASIPMLPSDATIIQMKNLLRRTKVEYVPIYHKQHHNIIGVALPRDLLKDQETKRIRDCARPPWFITEQSGLGDIIRQFRNNKENVAIILNQQGNAIGLITLNLLLEEVFGKSEPKESIPKTSGDFTGKSMILKDLSFSGDTLVQEFNRKFGVDLGFDPESTLSDMVIEVLGHPPESGDQITLANFEIIVKEASLVGVKTVSISSKVR
ncbi:MAG: hemolysin family protein [Chlamydiota bacterium]|nr:hemolysin family protein [Chlamydiota bacterium]